MIVLGIIGGIILLVFLATAFTGAPYVPTHRKELVEIFDKLRPLKPNDVVLDIGSGDGVVLAEIATRGVTHVVGYEINPFLVLISRWRLRKYGQTVQVDLKNLWSSRFPDATTLVYTFGESRDIAKMYAKVQEEATRLARPLEFISYGFAVPEVKPKKQYRAHFLYVVTPLHPGEA